MAIHYRTQAFILKKTDRGETDQILTVYTKDFGKLEILGRAMRKIASKLRSQANLFQLSEIEFIQGKAYKTLTDAATLENFSEIKKNLRKLALSYKISKMVDNLVRGEGREERIWKLLRGTLSRLNAQDLKPETDKLLYYYFFWNLLASLGYQPELHRCSACQNRLIPPHLYMNFEEGGTICKSCFLKTQTGKRISPESIKILRFLIEREWKTTSRLKIDEKYFKSLQNISKYWLHSLLPAYLS